MSEGEPIVVMGEPPGRPRVSEAGGDRAATFVRLADDQLLRAYRLATLLLGSELEAQDVVHDAAVTAWERFTELRDPTRFEPWFQRILVNRCRDRMRRRVRIRMVPIDHETASRTTSDDADRLVERAALRDALAELSPEHREVVVLRYLADLTVDEIADRIGERSGTVKSRLHYGLRSLRGAYDAAARLSGETSR